jgi:hypothetical protein
MANPQDAKWSLIDGGTLEGELLVAARPVLFELVAGINISFEPRNGLNLVNAAWSQGIYSNYTLGSEAVFVDPYYHMDVLPEDPSKPDQLPPPLYPRLQPEDHSFFDEPKAPWPSGFFDGIAMISAADFVTRELTVFEGIAYGFKLSACAASSQTKNLIITEDACPCECAEVAEPPAYWLLMLGVVGLSCYGRRRNRVLLGCNSR